jgi:hypothetical protein
MRAIATASAVTVLLLGGACKSLDVPDYYAGDLSSLEGGAASKTTVLTALQGLPIGTRDVMSGIVTTFGEIGREGYSLDPTNPDANAGRLVAPSRSLGSGTWSGGYRAIRQGYVVLHALDKVTGMTDAEKEASRGWTKTLMAVDLLTIINVFDQTGASVDVDHPVDAALPPLVSKQAAFTEVLRLLDEGRTHLLAGGSSFPFILTPGFAGFTTPANFLKVNRAIRAQVDAYQQNWAAALTDLAASFMDTSAALSLGAYNSYSTNAGDVVNPLYDPLPRTLVALPTIITDAKLRADGSPDLRATQKTGPMTPRTLNSITVVLKWNIYKAAGDPFPIIKNEELILLRAEAEMACTGVYPAIACNGNRAAAVAYIDVVRDKSGGLARLGADPGPGGSLSGDLLLDELLYNRNYSLIWEGAHRWIDMRRYGLLAKLPRARAGDIVVPYSALPDAECIPRNNPAQCTLPPNL